MDAAAHIFLAGVGGMGMAPLAILLRASGARVTGWDDDLRAPVREHLVAAGIALASRPELPEDTTLLVRSSAVGPSHPLVATAVARGIPVERRGERLAALASTRRLVAIAGSHGKTSTCAWLVHALLRAGVPASWAIGGLPADGAPPARWDEGSDWLVAEVDESDGTIEGFSPEITVVVNLDWDHPDQYPDEASLRAAFDRLFARTRSRIVVPRGDLVAAAARAVAGPATDVVDFEATGDFQSRNAAAAEVAFLGMTGGLPPQGWTAGYPGVMRRQTVLLETPALAVVEDYAHHPTEIAALLAWARRRFPGRRVATVFQPHRYTRTERYRAEFARALASGSDHLALLDVYAAGESPVEGGTTRDLAAELPSKVAAETRLLAWQEELEEAVAPWRAAGGPLVLLFVGAGDIDAWARAFVYARPEAIAEVSPASGSPSVARDWLDALATSLSPSSLVSHDEPLLPRTTLRVGGSARWYAEPADERDLVRVLAAARERGVPVFFLGRGSNLVVDDAGFEGLVIRLDGPSWTRLEAVEGGRFDVGAGLRLKALSARAAREGLDGFEFLDGIPGTVGGSLRMNAGAMGGWIFERVESVRVLDEELQVREVPVADFHPAYRSCPELERWIVLGARFAGSGHSTPERVRAKLDAHAQYRRKTQPREASAGCAFRNPPGSQAGKLIDLAGLKGTTVGDAMVSPVHANFLVNRGRAGASDYLRLIDLVKGEVRRMHGIELETEVIRLGGGGKHAA